MSKFRKCPFCGGRDQSVLVDDTGHGYVYCHSCGAQGPVDIGGGTVAVLHWNNRPKKSDRLAYLADQAAEVRWQAEQAVSKAEKVVAEIEKTIEEEEVEYNAC